MSQCVRTGSCRQYSSHTKMLTSDYCCKLVFGLPQLFCSFSCFISLFLSQIQLLVFPLEHISQGRRLPISLAPGWRGNLLSPSAFNSNTVHWVIHCFCCSCKQKFVLILATLHSWASSYRGFLLSCAVMGRVGRTAKGLKYTAVRLAQKPDCSGGAVWSLLSMADRSRVPRRSPHPRVTGGDPTVATALTISWFCGEQPQLPDPFQATYKSSVCCKRTTDHPREPLMDSFPASWPHSITLNSSFLLGQRPSMSQPEVRMLVFLLN